MSNVIEDGTGRGYKAEVDDHGRLSVKASMVGHMSHHATYHKDGYIKSFQTTLASTNETPIALLYNDSASRDLELYWLKISANANVEIKIYVNGVYTSGGSEVVFVNTNLSSNATPSVISYEGGVLGDLLLDTTNQALIDGSFIGANTHLIDEYDGGVVLTFKKSIHITATGTGSDKVKVTLGFAGHAAGTRL